MRRPRVTVTTLAAALVVAVTTLSLGALGVAEYLTDRNQEWAHLRTEAVGEADELAAAVALPLWNFDFAQIDRVLTSQMSNPNIQAAVVRQLDVSAPGGFVIHARVRDARGGINVIHEAPPPDQLLLQERQVATPSGDPLGTVQVYMTPRAIQVELRTSLYRLLGVILILDTLLSGSLYLMLWWIVLKPLKEIERYAATIRAEAPEEFGASTTEPAPDASPLSHGYFARELRSLEASITHMVRLLRGRLAELQKTQTMLSIILDSVPYFVFWKDTRGVYLGCNRALAEMAGLRNAGEIVGKTDFDLPWPREVVETYRAHDQEVITSNQPKRHIIEPVGPASGPRRWSDTTKVPLLDANGNTIGVLGVAEDITERKEAEEALHREKAFNEAILHGMPGVLFLHDEQGRLVKWNSRATTVYGYSDEELKGKHFLDWMPEDEKERTLATVREVMEKGHAEMEGNVLLKGGRRVPHVITGIRLTIEGKAYMLVVGIDIAKRKRAEEALRQEKALTEAIFDNVPGVIHLYDEHKRLVRWNARATELSGFSDEELMNKAAGAGRTGEDQAGVADAIERVMREGRAALETTLVTKSGVAIPCLIRGVRVTFNEKPYVLGVAIDISDRKRAEDTLRREKAFIDAVFDNVPAVLSLYDESGRLIRWNRRSKEITGFSDEELAKRCVGEAQPVEERERIIASARQTLAEGHAVIEATVLTKGGERIPFYYTGVRVMLDGRPHILSIGVDIRERKQAEEHLRRALDEAEAANRAKDQFLAAASHELRTPLTPVLLLASMLEADPDMPPAAREDIAQIREHVELEKRLIGDLLDFTAIHAGKLQMRPVPTDVHEVLNAAIRTCQEGMQKKGMRIDVHFDARHSRISGDPDRLRQVFWNLLQNAYKFSPAGSAITIQTFDDADHWLRIELSDTGIGMDAETLQRLFRPFEQGPRDISHMQHYGGLGLGLAICKALVEAHGGSISAMSEGPGRGSKFIIRLPGATEVIIPPANQSPAIPTGEPPRFKLLLVEDHPVTLETLSRVLSAEGHEVTTATTVQEALKAAASAPFDLVLADIGLPDGSGLDLMPVLRDRYHLAGIAISGYGADSDLEASRNAGFFSHITKPVTMAAVRECLAQFAASRLAATAP